MNLIINVKEDRERKINYIKKHLKETTGLYYEEVFNLIRELYNAGYIDQAKKFMELAYLHLRNNDKTRYNIVRCSYIKLLRGTLC